MLSIKDYRSIYLTNLESNPFESSSMLKLPVENKKTIYGLDIETYPVNRVGYDAEFCAKRSKIRLIQIFNPISNTVCVFDMLKLTAEEIEQLKKFIASKTFYIHNALFDVRFLQALGIPFVRAKCTMIMYSLVLKSIYPDSKKFSCSLKDCVHNILQTEISKLEQVSDWSAPELTESQLEYAGYDAYLCWNVGAKLENNPAVRTDNFKIMCNVINALARIINNGVYINVPKLDALIKEWTEACDSASAECDKFYKDINVRSGVQLGDWIANNIPQDILATWPKTAKDRLKTDTPTLVEYEEVEALKPLVKFKKFQKYLTTYGEPMKKFINPVDGRLHPNYTIAFTESGRLSSMNPNVQNFPRGGEYRGLFTNQFEDTTLVCADYSQVEVRVAAILSHDVRMLEAYRTGKDLYKLTASLILHKTEDTITKAERQRAKAVVLGLQFGMGANKLCLYAKQYGVEMSNEESKQLVKNYRLAYPDLYAWQMDTTEKAAMSLRATTVGGMIRKLSSDNYYTCSLNTPVQGSAAEAILYAIALLDREFIFHKLPAKIVATVHDEILVECKKEVAEKVKTTLEDCMMLGFNHVFPNDFGAINNIVEAHIGNSWYDAK